MKFVARLILILILLALPACQQNQDSSLPSAPPEAQSTINDEIAAFSQISPGATIRFEHISLEEGLSQSVVNAIAQDKIGFLWFGTQDGLNRYDGYSFITFKADPEDPNTLSDDWITTLHADEDGSLWIGTNQGGVNRYDAISGTISRFSADPEQKKLSNAHIHTLFKDYDNNLWIGANYGLSRWNMTSQTLSYYPQVGGDSTGINMGAVTAIFQDSLNRLWVGSEKGLYQYSPGEDAFHPVTGIQEGEVTLTSSAIYAIAEDSTGLLWLGTNKGLIWFDPQSGLYSSYVHNPENNASLAHDFIHDVRIDRSGILWIGTEWGLDRYDPATDTFIHHRNNPLVENSLATNVVYSIFEDREGLLWFGTWGGGVNKYNPRQNQFAFYRNDPNRPDSLSGNIFPIFADADGSVWIGVIGVGLDKFDSATGSVTHYLYDPSRSDGLSSPNIFSILRDSHGTLWLATAYGLDELDEEHNQFIHHKLNETGSNVIRAIFEDAQGRFWVGSNGGLYLFDRAADQFTSLSAPEERNPIPPFLINNIFPARNGDLWITTSGMGFYRYDPEQQVFTRFQRDETAATTLATDIVLSAYEDEEKNLWLATTGGLNKMDLLTRKFSLFTEKQGLPNNFIYCVIADQEGALWLTTNYGLSRFDPKKGVFQNYSAEDGLQSNEFNSNACARAADGSIYIGGVNGMNRFFPEKVTTSVYLPPIVLTQLTSGGQPFLEDTVAESVKEVTLKWPNNSFEFEFSALSYSQPEEYTYAYRMDHFDKEWNELRDQRVGRYTNMPGGEYTLHLRSTNPAGLIHEEPQTIHITVVPPFWQTTWFIAFGILLIAGTGYGGYRLRVGAILHQKQELERQVCQRTLEMEKLFNQTKDLAIIEERNRLARDLHDSAKQKAFAALAQLGTAKGLIQRNVRAAEKHMSEAENLVHDVIQELTFLIQEMYPMALQEKGLVTTLREYIFEWENRTDIQINLVAENEKQLPLDLEQALYRITQETLANVARHSRASHVTVNLIYQPENVTLTISDNGIGFDMAQKPKGIGLRSIRERAERIGGETVITSVPGNGTHIEIRIPFDSKAGG